MFESTYYLLERLGYTHPLHPTITNVPMGMVIGAFVLGVLGRVLRHTTLVSAARYCIVLALVALFPTALLGYMDWYHYFGGATLFPIKMMITLAGILLALLMVAVILGRKAAEGSAGTVLIYALCLATVILLGYFGGDMVFGGWAPKNVAGSAEIRAGAGLFAKTCSPCHPNGGNALKPDLPLKAAPQLAQFETFLTYIRAPKARDGSENIMPPFPPERIPEAEAREIYQYIVKELKQE